MNPQLTQISTIIIGSIISLGILAAGFGYFFAQWKRGGNEYNTNLINNLKDLLKSEQEKNVELLKEKQELFITLQAQIAVLQKETAELRGTVLGQTKMIDQYKELLTNRNPELEKTLKEISVFLKGLSGMAHTAEDRNVEIDKATEKEDGNVLRKK